MRQEEILHGEDNVDKEEAESLSALENVGDGLDKDFKINPVIYRVEGLNAGPETTEGPYLPVSDCGILGAAYYLFKPSQTDQKLPCLNH